MFFQFAILILIIAIVILTIRKLSGNKVKITLFGMFGMFVIICLGIVYTSNFIHSKSITIYANAPVRVCTVEMESIISDIMDEEFLLKLIRMHQCEDAIELAELKEMIHVYDLGSIRETNEPVFQISCYNTFKKSKINAMTLIAESLKLELENKTQNER